MADAVEVDRSELARLRAIEGAARVAYEAHTGVGCGCLMTDVGQCPACWHREKRAVESLGPLLNLGPSPIISNPVAARCPLCNGNGLDAVDIFGRCPACRGTGIAPAKGNGP